MPLADRGPDMRRLAILAALIPVQLLDLVERLFLRKRANARHAIERRLDRIERTVLRP